MVSVHSPVYLHNFNNPDAIKRYKYIKYEKNKLAYELSDDIDHIKMH